MTGLQAFRSPIWPTEAEKALNKVDSYAKLAQVANKYKDIISDSDELKSLYAELKEKYPKEILITKPYSGDSLINENEFTYPKS